MSKLNKLVGKGKKIKIGEVELEIKPLTVSSLPLFMQMEKDPGVVKDIIAITLRDSVPDATDEEVDKVAIEHALPIMEAIMEVNQLEMDEEKKAFLERIKGQNVRHAETDGDKAR